MSVVGKYHDAQVKKQTGKICQSTTI